MFQEKQEKILLHNADCFFKLSFMYIELPVLKGDLVEEEVTFA